MTTRILGISGSLRSGSFNTALLKAALEMLAPSAATDIADIGALPLYNADLDGDDKPAPVARLLEQIASADGLLIAAPEYNYGIPGTLKNAIDWASRPAYKSVLAHKPTAIFGASRSAVGSARSQSQLRQVLGGTLTPVMPHPDFLVGAAHQKFDEDGALADDDTRNKLRNFTTDLLRWIESQRSHT